MYHLLTYGFLLLSVLQIACVYSRTVSDGCYGEARGRRQAEETELWQSVVQPSEELRVVSVSSSSASGSDSASASRSIRRDTQERYNMWLPRTFSNIKYTASEFVFVFMF